MTVTTDVEALLSRVEELEEAKDSVEQAIDAIENAIAGLPHDIHSPHLGTDEWENVLSEIESELEVIEATIGGLV